MAPSATAAPPGVLSIDAMGGDRGPSVVVAGMAKAAAKNADLRFILHGPKDELAPLVAAKKVLHDRCEIRHAADAVSMREKPSHALRNAQGTSMWSALESVRQNEAPVAISCGNTGALMLLSMTRLKTAPGVNRPAIACLWPSRNPGGWNVMLDVGADLRADANDLLNYTLMGASYARNGLDLERPRVGLLNVGTEDHKGRSELRAAHDRIAACADPGGYDFVGFVEGGDLPSDRVDVIVTDGFTGNIALKTAEGTAGLLRDFLRDAFRHTWLSRVGALFAYTSLRRLSKRMDPRRMNGGVFLGLNGTVIKSHGASDATAVAAAIKLAWQLARSGLSDRIAARIAASAATVQAAVRQENGTGI